MFLTVQKKTAREIILSSLSLSALQLRVKQTFWADSLEEGENIIIDQACCVGRLLRCQPGAYFQAPENTQEIINDSLVIILIAH